MPRILLVEDSPTQSEELKFILESEGYEVEAASDGETAYETLAVSSDFDLVLSDVQMPRLSGYDLCRRIKEHPQRKNLPVLLLTVHNEPEQVMQGLECGADLFIAKPYHVEDLVTAIQSTLAEHSIQLQRPFRMGDGIQVSFLGRNYVIGEDKDRALEYLVASLESFVRGKDRELEARLREERQRPAAVQGGTGSPEPGLIGNLCHHLNNSLAAILGHAGLLAVELKSSGDLLADLEPIQSLSRRLASLTSRLGIVTDQEAPRPETLDLNELLDGLEPLLRSSAGGDLHVVMDQGPGLHLVSADRSELRTAVLELARNARDASPDGGVLVLETANVELTPADAQLFQGAAPGKYVSLTVIDSGEGMSLETLARAGQTFFTTRAEDQHFGMGLATVYAVARRAGGHIALDSSAHQGTTVRLLLPAQEDSSEGLADDETRAESEAGNGDPATGTILVVEDRENIRELVARILDEHGFLVLQAADAQEAQRIFRTAEPAVDLVLTDIRLPDMPGTTLAGVLQDERPGTRVLFTSGYIGPVQGLADTWQKAPLLRKPFEPDDLLASVREALR